MSKTIKIELSDAAARYYKCVLRDYYEKDRRATLNSLARIAFYRAVVAAGEAELAEIEQEVE